jgi:hypothetical protein
MQGNGIFRKGVIVLSLAGVISGYYYLFGTSPEASYGEVVFRAKVGTLLTFSGGMALFVYSFIRSR